MKTRSAAPVSCGLARRHLLLAPALWPGLGKAQAPRIVRFVRPPVRVAPDRWYPYALLRAALDASGERFLIETRESLTPARAQRELQDARGVIDIFAMAHSPERERAMQMLPLPLYRGLFGWRLLLVRPAIAARLQGIQDLPGLRRLRLLQGDDWPDTPILRGNGVQVEGGSSLPHRLLEMLVAGRADAFPRSPVEAWREVDGEPPDAPRFAVLPGVALRYRCDRFFFLRPQDASLAQALGRGLDALQRSGRFEALLREFHGEAIARSALHERRLIELRNPLLTPLLRAQPEALWTLPH